MKRPMVALTIGLLLGALACERESRERAAPSPRTTAASPDAACPAKRLAPNYLPSGLRETEAGPVIQSPEWVRTWRDGRRSVQVLGGISADRGDDPGAKRVGIRGAIGVAGPLTLQNGEYFVVDWAETETCGRHQYAVASKGISGPETAKIATSLQEEK